MNIEEAIEINKQGWGTDKQIKEAKQLGIEALERLRTLRGNFNILAVVDTAQGKLPSETE